MRGKTKTPSTAPTVPGANGVELGKPTPINTADCPTGASADGPPTRRTRKRQESATEAVLFEHIHRGDVWRLEVVRHDGRRFANLRKWYRKDGDLLPTRAGCVIPVERLAELRDNLDGWLVANETAG